MRASLPTLLFALLAAAHAASAQTWDIARPVSAAGKFQLVLPQPVLGGQRVEAVTVIGPDQSTDPAALIVSDPGDWARATKHPS